MSSQFVPELNIALTCVTDSQKIPTDDVRPLTSLQGLVNGSTSLLGRRGHPHSCTRVFHLTRIGRDDGRLGGDVTNSFLREMSSPVLKRVTKASWNIGDFAPTGCRFVLTGLGQTLLLVCSGIRLILIN